MRKTLFKLFVGALILFFLMIAYGVLFERTHLEINNIRISSEKFDSNFDGLMLVQLSDLHMSRWTAHEQRIVETANSMAPDVIVITGDVFKSKRLFEQPESEAFQTTLSNVVRFISNLKAPLGIYLCRGNNDFGDDKEVSDIFLDAMRGIDAQVIVNRHIKLPGESDVYLLGVDYPDFEKIVVGDFVVSSYDEGTCLQSDVSFKNSYSHVLLRTDRSQWQNYIYSGKFRSSAPDSGGLGVTFYSQFDRGYDRFYRLRKRAGFSTFILSPHGTPMPQGKTEFDLTMEPNAWYLFKVECQNDSIGTYMRAKVWHENTPEPDTWQIDALDANATFESGTIGVWSHGEHAIHQFADLAVISSSGDTLWQDNFADVPDKENPPGWVDFNYEYQAIPWLAEGIPDSAFSILLAHTPDMVLQAEPAGIDLLLSGHTHGGQIRIPGWGPPLVPIELGRRYTQGFFQFGDTQVYVNRGLGTVLLPIRLFCRPEITVFRLEAGKK